MFKEFAAVCCIPCVCLGKPGRPIPLIRTEYSQETLEFYVTFGFENKKWQSWNLRRPFRVRHKKTEVFIYLFKGQIHLLLLFFNYLKDPGQYFLKIIKVFTARVGYRIKFTCFLFFGNTWNWEFEKKKPWWTIIGWTPGTKICLFLGNWGPPWCYRAMALIEFQKHILSTKAECEVASWLVLGTVVQCLHCFSWQPPSLFPA